MASLHRRVPEATVKWNRDHWHLTGMSSNPKASSMLTTPSSRRRWLGTLSDPIGFQLTRFLFELVLRRSNPAQVLIKQHGERRHEEGQRNQSIQCSTMYYIAEPDPKLPGPLCVRSCETSSGRPVGRGGMDSESDSSRLGRLHTTAARYEAR